jgi:hypothetical protein
MSPVLSYINHIRNFPFSFLNIHLNIIPPQSLDIRSDFFNWGITTHIQGVFKKRPNFCYKDFILQHFKHCPLQSSLLYWRYTVPSVSSIVGMLHGTHFLWWRAVLLSHFPESPRVKKKSPNFLNSAPTSIEGALRLLSALSGRFWQQTAIGPISLWRLMLIAKRGKWQFVVKTYR